MHDGAIIISNNIVKATRVVLPINNEKVIPNRYGLRHRAAVSITEKTDAVAIVVSEENGKISYIKNGKFIEFTSTDNLLKIIEKEVIRNMKNNRKQNVHAMIYKVDTQQRFKMIQKMTTKNF